MANSGTLMNRDQGFAIADCMLETGIDPSPVDHIHPLRDR